MPVNTLPDPVASACSTSLGSFLRDRRSRLQPGPEAQIRRRTPGLRREEVATRANVSVAWYTWLEQGRGGPPSNEVLERLARALELDAAGREMLFLLAQQRPPPLSPVETSSVTPALQRVLDGMPTSAAIVKTPTWDVVAWNAAAVAVLGDYPALPVRERNVLRRLFGDPTMRACQPHWEESARVAVAVFRFDIARMGGSAEASALAAELQDSSEDFRRLWAENDVLNHWGGTKQMRHSVAGHLTLEYSAFPVAGADGLSMVVFTPVTPADVEAVKALVSRQAQLA
ncbi:helix-turn-helix transcriptional regulator [Paraburkholderia bryophila]|uniref:Transcriptional regulator with XRE-family HTH domain n=1 Tax=Paraburkholderia bryophila TaxID=420952 RepID=A0A7Y9W8L2_9BURK|nr:helix-turn-helix transcriptional regulator [Paraburkholderia bryophila]NYH16212.1 transcriptional regulator with XRE-family HTH domain [Paraburkholderia bryophila]